MAVLLYWRCIMAARLVVAALAVWLERRLCHGVVALWLVAGGWWLVAGWLGGWVTGGCVICIMCVQV